VTVESGVSSVGAAPVTVDSLALPAGKFVLSAALQVFAEARVDVWCKLINSTNVGSGSFSAVAASTTIELPVMGYADLASATTVSLECSLTTGSSVTYAFARMSAMQVGTLNVQ
jgi:hypothetical protein